MRGRVLHAGAAEAPAIVLSEPLSLWGGVDPASGAIVETRHPQRDASLAGRVVVMPAVRGSSSSASVLVEAIRAAVGPAALVLGEPDLILAVGAAVAQELYGVSVPVIVADPAVQATIRDGATVRVTVDGQLTWDPVVGPELG